ncbi:MAG: CBS and ACT domain-containing protein [Dehalococcoidia bacterium]|nr:CBS and ACT domain-containing protein [Dehalococcoidia bacterium]
MYVKDYMVTNVITVTSETLVTDAQDIMKRHDVRRLPVVDHGRLAGLVTMPDIKEAAPSSATSLSIWELHYLLAKLKVGEIMTKASKLVTVSPDTTIEAAARIARQHKIGSLLVVENKDHLLGLLTDTGIFDILIDILGPYEGTVRLHFSESFKGKPLGEITDTINKHRMIIHSMFVVTVPGSGRKDLIVRLGTTDASAIINDFRAKGYTVEQSA